jgi:hypothetical protein
MALVNECDICDDRIVCSDDNESQIDMLDEIEGSYERESRLPLCNYCTKEYLIPGFPI